MARRIDIGTYDGYMYGVRMLVERTRLDRSGPTEKKQTVNLRLFGVHAVLRIFSQ